MSDKTEEYTSSVGVRDSVIYHDPVNKTESSSDESSSVEAASDVFVTVARKRSVFIKVDKWSTEPTTIKEQHRKSMHNHDLLEDVTYAKVNKKQTANPGLDEERLEKDGTEASNNDICYGVVDDGANSSIQDASQNGDDATYGVVNKSSRIAMDASQEDVMDDDATYGIVNKSSKISMHGSTDTSLVGHYDDLDLVCDRKDLDDIGNTDDLYSKVDEDLNETGQKTSRACINGKVVAVSDEGDYASVEYLSDSDTEATGIGILSVEPTVQKRDCNSEASRTKSDKHCGLQQNRYAVKYLGSVPIKEEELSAHLSSVAVAQCIVTVLNHVSQDPTSAVIYEWPKDTKMFMEISEGRQKLKLQNSISMTDHDDHFLHAIRIWAVGKEVNSKHFAYVIRNGSKGHVCRVFVCEVSAKNVASTIRNICQRLASQELNNADESKRRSTYSVNSVAFSTSESRNNGNTKNEPGGVSLMGTADKESQLSLCCYIGVVKVKEPSGKEAVNSATEKVFTTISKEKWTEVDVCVSPTSIDIKRRTNSGEDCLSLPVETVTHVGSSTRNKRLAAILTQGNEDLFRAHVFLCDPSAKWLTEQIQTMCQVGDKEKGGKGTSQKQKGLRGALLGKLMAKKQGSDTDSK